MLFVVVVVAVYIVFKKQISGCLEKDMRGVGGGNCCPSLRSAVSFWDESKNIEAKCWL